MRLALALALFAVPVSTLADTPSSTPDMDILGAQARELIAPLAQELQQTVHQSVITSGRESAVAACHSLAPTITDNHQQASWSIRRTALKTRNPDNRPDPWEVTVLERFVTAATQGTPASELRHAELVNGEFRYMQAIPTGEGCLACHGKAVDPGILAVVEHYYPDDQATGFSLNDVRGAFSVRHRLNEP